jgi:serine phosphatase RsbU (regulator of sigma subunit)
MVKQRTVEIVMQKNEIEAQRDHANKQKKEITDSIQYAKRIQSAIFPPNEFISKLVQEHFILNKPRDIVSGDFYWLNRIGNRIILAVADCTGHGVPGAFMSILGIAFLNQIINQKKLRANRPSCDYCQNELSTLTAADILNELRDQLITALHQTGKSGENKDGMDISLCIIDLKSMDMQFSGAHNPVYLIRNNELIEYKGDKMPIGIQNISSAPFKNKVFKIQKDDRIYLFSDGFIDQFGGTKNKKFMTKNFKNLLIEQHLKPFDEQVQNLNQTIEQWKGEHKQIDDILVFGLRF